MDISIDLNLASSLLSNNSYNLVLARILRYTSLMRIGQIEIFLSVFVIKNTFLHIVQIRYQSIP
jgi:hypothetical protein